MSNDSATINSEKVIKELDSLVVKFNYSESIKRKRTKLDKKSIWEIAKKVGEHLSDDTLPSSASTRP